MAPNASPKPTKRKLSWTKRQEVDQDLKISRMHYLDSADKEYENPECAVMSRVASHREGLQQERKANEERNNVMLAKMQDLEQRVSRLETTWLVISTPNITIGKAQFRDEYIKKLMDTSAKVNTLQFSIWNDICNKTNLQDGQEVADTEFKPTVDQDASRNSFKTSTRADSFAGFHTRDTFKRFLDSRNLSRLAGSFSLVHDANLRDARNTQTHDNFYKIFAYTVVEGARLGDSECHNLLYGQAEAFEFRYGCSWEEAAEKAKIERGRSVSE